jgi:tetratricopeptide (TPR) repeat protein
VTLCAEGHADWDDRAQDALDRLIDEAKDLPDTASARRVVELVDLAPPRADGTPAELQRRLDRIVALADLGRHAEIIEAMNELVLDWARSGVEPDSLLGVVRLFGLMLIEADLIDDAVELYQLLLDGTGTTSYAGTVLRLDLATALQVGDRVGEAIVVLQAVVDDLDDPDTRDAAGAATVRQAQLELARALHSVGRDDEALQVVVDAIASLGDDGQIDEVLALVAERARIEGSRGDADEAVHQLTRLATTATAELGDADPRVLRVRYQLHQAERAAGRLASAIDGLSLLVVRSTDVLGVDHPDTSHVVEQLAVCELEADRAERAVDLLDAHLDELGAHLGSDHLRVADLQGSLGAALVAAGRPERAVAVLGSALDASIGARGPDRIETLVLRSRLRDAFDVVGDEVAALEQEREVAAGLTRIHGPDHPWALEAGERVRRRLDGEG